jgi:hypothetical protein
MQLLRKRKPTQGLPMPNGLDPQQRAAAEADWQFLLQLLDNRRVGDYEVPVPLKVSHGGCPGVAGGGAAKGLWICMRMRVCVSSSLRVRAHAHACLRL